MQFSEALALVRANSQRTDLAPFRLHLAAGFTANHLALFMTAHAAATRQDRRASCSTGRYGDVVMALDDPQARETHVAIVALEWADLDPRLGLRRYVMASGDCADDILRTAHARLDMLAEAIIRQADSAPVILSLPTLPLPPVFSLPGRQSGLPEIALRRQLLTFAERCLGARGVSVISSDRLSRHSALMDRRSATGEVGADMPYGQMHLSALAKVLVESALPPPPLKGLVTDLDDTLWRGLVGEVGPDRVTWDLDAQSHMHAVYQAMLAGLADQGVLIAVASKNDPAVVAKAFERSDLRIKPDMIFPMEVSWGAKSSAVERILSAWNIGADAIAFVDDSPIEIAEVQSRFPQVTGLLFPTRDEEAALAMFEQIRDLYGRERVSDDDRLRSASIRRNAEVMKAAGAKTGSAAETFLEGLQARLVFNFSIYPEDDRPFDLVNKTNQFNLNGRRIDAAEWKRHLRAGDRFAVAISYSDKFGPLGTISIAAGHIEGSQIVLTSWVLSCRAFARRIEHATLAVLSERLKLCDFRLDFRATDKNAPFQDFLASLDAIHESDHSVLINPTSSLPPLYHERETHEP